jgi:hypothetical protein
MAIHVEGLSRPEHDHREEVCARDKGDDESEGEDSRLLLEAAWKHGPFGPLDFPDREGDEEQNTAEDDWDEDVSGGPLVLISAPFDAGQEQDHARNAEEATDKVDFGNYFHLAKAAGVWSGWWEIEKEGAKEACGGPSAAKGTAIPPASMRGDQLTPKHRRAKRDDGEDEYSNVFPPFAGGCQFGGDGKRGEFTDACANSGDGKGTCPHNQHMPSGVIGSFWLTDKCAHRLGSAPDAHGDDEKQRAGKGNISSSKEIGERAHEWADGRQSQ